MSDRMAGGPRGGSTFAYQKRPGWRLTAVWKDRQGQTVREIWEPPLKPERAAEPAPIDRVRRGALSAEAQGSLL
jgi:hypothetical protein